MAVQIKAVTLVVTQEEVVVVTRHRVVLMGIVVGGPAMALLIQL
ncbi:hypothetical protein M621_02120 [Serratia plymuthica S13]|uniref:Uncharacterized protein n=1 Tax=Serratia plymuthica S13 TaxID=1348660 RepID=S4YV35_SERPL|nr:hypothetical protein M621_02120 [Serratia plymuthica S13]